MVGRSALTRRRGQTFDNSSRQQFCFGLRGFHHYYNLIPSIMANLSAALLKDDNNRVRISEENIERLPVAPDTFNPRYKTTRKEIWSWYLYYISSSGLTLFNLAPTAFQNLVSQAAGDAGVLHFAGR